MEWHINDDFGNIKRSKQITVLKIIEMDSSLSQYALLTIIASKKDKSLRCPIEDWYSGSSASRVFSPFLDPSWNYLKPNTMMFSVNNISNILTGEIKPYLWWIVKYRTIVVRYSVRYCRKLCKLSWVIANIIIEHSNVLVPIPSLLLMPHSQYVTNFMHRYTKL